MIGDKQRTTLPGWLLDLGQSLMFVAAVYLSGRAWDWATDGLPSQARGSAVVFWLALLFMAVCALQLLLSWIAMSTAGTRRFPTNGLLRVTDQPENMKPPVLPKLVTIAACLFVAAMGFAAWQPLVMLAQGEEWLKVIAAIGSQALGLAAVVWAALGFLRRRSPANSAATA